MKKKRKRSLQEMFESWRANVAKLQSGDQRKSKFVTNSGISLKDLYLPEEDGAGASSYLAKLGFPGTYPFTRGVQATMYRGRLWTMRQYAGFGTAKESNERFHYLLSQGNSGLSVAFDLPTQMGRDSDHPLSRGEVGRVGVAIDSLEDMEVLFDGIPLAEVSTSMTINATAHILLAFYLMLARKRGIPWNKLRGTVQNDVLKEYIARGTYIYPPGPSLKIATDIIEFCRLEVPEWNTISISGYHIREAGSTAVQEVAFTLADGIAYVEHAIKRGLAVDSFAPKLSFFFNCHNNFLEEIAKFRAARRMWARIMKERFGAKDERSCMLKFHTQTAGSTLTAQQSEVNIVRTSIQALAAVLGGTQSLHTNAFDEALGLPTKEAATLALRTQQVVASESGVADIIDPLGGSYALEALTDEIESRAFELIAKIDELGGMIKAIEAGVPQQDIEEASYAYQRAIEEGDLEVVGVNVQAVKEENPRAPKVLKVDEKLEVEQCARLRGLRARRDETEVKAAISRLDSTIAADGNVMPAVCEAVSKFVTLGEISDVLRARFGEYRQ